jgi:RNA polymerase sigma factor (sigma-70 family)
LDAKRVKEMISESFMIFFLPKCMDCVCDMPRIQMMPRIIMQEGFIKVFQKIEQYTKKGSLEGWIRRIMINTALEKYRSHVIMQSVDEKTATKNDLVYEETIQNISADDIISIIQTLTPKYRMVFNLYAIEGYSHKEIAEKLGISEGTSKSNLSRARTILQEKVNELFYVSGEKIK